MQRKSHVHMDGVKRTRVLNCSSRLMFRRHTLKLTMRLDEVCQATRGRKERTKKIKCVACQLLGLRSTFIICIYTFQLICINIDNNISTYIAMDCSVFICLIFSDKLSNKQFIEWMEWMNHKRDKLSAGENIIPRKRNSSNAVTVSEIQTWTRCWITEVASKLNRMTFPLQKLLPFFATPQSLSIDKNTRKNRTYIN